MKKLFGTDGIRGIANQYPMTSEVAVKLGKAIAISLNNGKNRPKILIGKDTRISGYLIESALTSGICSSGADVLLVGPMPTPAIAHLTKSFAADAGIVISASHNPAEHNGIKIFDKEGFKLSDKLEEEIEKMVLSKKESDESVKGGKIGKAFRIDDAKGRYIEFAKNTIKNHSLSNLKIVLDCANGAAYHIAPDIFRELGAEVVVLNNKPDGLNINLRCGALYPNVIREKVLEEKADIGIAFDGDADRVIMVDGEGNDIDGDCIMAICAIEMKNKLKNNVVVATTMSNIGFEIAMKNKGIKVVRTDVGDRYVVEEMKANNYNLGGEQSGHIIFFDYSTTGDGIITALQILNIMKRTGKKLSDLKECITTFPQIIKNVDVREKKLFEKMSKVMEEIKNAEKQLKDNGRIIVRYSGTENKARVMVEGKNEKEINEIADKIVNEIKKEVGE